MIKGKQSFEFEKPVLIDNVAGVVGQKEGNGNFKELFDKICEDPMFGQDSWELAESKLQELTIDLLLEKTSFKMDDVRYIFGGDLLGQLIATTYGTIKYQKPVIGLYSACATFGEALGMAALTIHSGAADSIIVVASSHFASAEKQFRFPLDYGNQRPKSSTWTITGCGAVMLTNKPGNVAITGITFGKMLDYGMKDSMNMGAIMAPAAADLIENNLKDFGMKADDYDMIITGDLGSVGKKILFDLLNEKGIDITKNHFDCGDNLFSDMQEEIKAGGSGAGCVAVTFCSYIFNMLKTQKWQKILLVPTGAMLSTVSFNEGQSIPGIAHGVVIEKI